MSTLDLLKNIVNVEQSSEKVFLVHMPILYSNGDWALIEVTENPGGTFNLNDCGTAILNAYSVVNQFDKLNVKKYLSQIINDFDVQIMHSGEIYLNNIPKEQIYSRMIEISVASQKFSEILINATMKQNEKNYTKGNYIYLGNEFEIKEFKNKDWQECIIEREKPLKTYNDFVKWLKTKGDVDEQWGYFFKENNKKNIGIRFSPVDVNLKINDIKLFAIFITAKFYTGTPEQCKRVIEAMLEE